MMPAGLDSAQQTSSMWRWDGRAGRHERPSRHLALTWRRLCRQLLGLGWYAALWLVLLSATAVVLLVEAVPIAVPNQALAASVAAVAGIVGLVLLYLGVVRFLAFGRTLDLFVGIGFGVLALANLAVRLTTLALVPDATWAAAPVLLLLLRAVSTVLFLIPLAYPGREIDHERRARYALDVG